jgi:hypothetical protein
MTLPLRRGLHEGVRQEKLGLVLLC